MEKLLNDLRYGLRNIKSRPTYATIALLTLTLGIGVTTAMYTLVNKVLLQPLPFPDSEQVVLIEFYNKKTNTMGSGSTINAYEQFIGIDTPFQSISFWSFDQGVIEKGDQQIPLTMLITSGNYMNTFEMQPLIGRWYDENDIDKQVIMISARLWRDEFDSDPDILNRTVTLNKKDAQVVGVMPDGFSSNGYSYADLFMPINKLDRNILLVARLKDGLTIEQAENQSDNFQQLVNEINRDSETIWELDYRLLLDNVVGDSKQSLYLLLASVIAVFIIAVLNVVNLTFAHYINRTQELAVRVSMGATKQRLLRQLLSENLLLCVIGGISGLLFAAWSIEWIQDFMGNMLPRASEISMDLNSIIFVLILIVVSSLATTLIPSFTLVNPEKLANAIKQAGHKATADKKSQTIRRLLVAGEVCVAVMLLISAGLLLRSYTMLANQEVGFDSQGVMTGHIWFSGDFQPKPNTATYWLTLADNLKEIPGVEKVAATSSMPMGMTGIDYGVDYSYPGAPAPEPGEEPRANIRSITPGYFDTLNIPLVEGRDFDFRDTQDSPKVVIINKHLANLIWPNESAIGNVLKLPSWIGGEHRVIGVVNNVKHRGLRANTMSEFFLPVTQLAYPGMSFVVKTNLEDPLTLQNAMLKASTDLEPTAPMIMLRTLTELTESSIISERIVLTILTIFAALALVLARIGVYGVSDNMVSQRTNEIGIRMAIGASPSMIRRWIIKDTASPVFWGAMIGLLLAFILSQFFASILYGVNSWDPVTFISIPIILFLVGLFATWFPAKRATKIHPQKALQYD